MPLKYSEFITKFVEIIITIFLCKNVSQSPSKILSTQCFFTDHSKHKTAEKAAFRIFSTNPRQQQTI